MAVGLTAIVGSLIYGTAHSTVSYQLLKIDDQVIKVEIANSSEERASGLSGRNKLPPDTGMLFIFERPDYYKFWMKDMKFAIDIIWIGENQKVVDITPNLSPQTFPQTWQPKLAAKYVLEVNAGFADQYQVNIGNVVELELKTKN
ncbi:DUF192 domain-containing protein [Candidatus Microgenomates bacterium]|nr:DUF192 domain-containing protein [Candidatus Microgenomates bacterium]